MISMFLWGVLGEGSSQKVPAFFLSLFPSVEYSRLKREVEELDSIIAELDELIELLDSMIEEGRKCG